MAKKKEDVVGTTTVSMTLEQMVELVNEIEAERRTVTAQEREPELRDRVVTLTVGQLTDALAEALKVVSDAAPAWKVGDRAFVEVEVVSAYADGSRVNLKLPNSNGTALFGVSTELLKGIN
jgi:hypothetical protein